MTDFTPTPEQEEIVAAAVETTHNLAVIARAGAAKTTTLILMAEALSKTDILSLAFNKKIAEEMAEKLPPNCEAKTSEEVILGRLSFVKDTFQGAVFHFIVSFWFTV